MHPIGICIVEAAVIGKNCTIGQNVTIGCGKRNENNIDFPIIGDNVVIFPNSTVVGGITIGDNAVIGCNSVVINDVPEGVTVAGNPAHIINNK